MRYRLATYRECKAHREWNTTCPDCGRKGKFSPYIDTTTMQPVDDKRCGRCNRLSNCGYHLPPRMVKNGFIKKEERYANSPSVYRGATRDERCLRRREIYLPKVVSGGSCLSLRPANYVSKRSAEQNDTTRSACNAPVLTDSHDSVVQGTALPSLSTAWHLANPLKASFAINRGGVSGDAERIHYSRMHRACEQSLPWGSHLVTWLRTKFSREQVDAALKRYHVGGTPDGATLWWQIDEQGRVHTGKAMQYNPLTGHRVKEQGFPVNWAHRMRIYGEPSELVVPQCLFGEHLAPLLSPQGGKTAMPEYSPLGEIEGAAIVESEKTALIMSLVCPDQVWLATGGKANFKESMLAPLIGLEVTVYPDADALHDWYARAVEMNRRLGTRLYIPTWYYNMMDHPEAIARGLDLADMLLDNQSSSPLHKFTPYPRLNENRPQSSDS